MESKKVISSFTSKNEVFFYTSIVGLSFAHFVTALRWIDWEIWNYFLADNFRTTCYGFFDNCSSISFSTVYPIKVILLLYLIISFSILIPIFLKNRKIILIIFFILFFIKCFLFISRYNLMGNYHVMHLALIIFFLSSVKFSFFYRVGLCLQYFWAGTLKLNLEWLSGAALLRYPALLERELFLFSLGYVVVLELFLCWGLVSKNIYVRRLTLVQLIIFHLYSYLIVGSFYPLIMLGILFPILVEDFSNINYKSYFERGMFSMKYSLSIILLCMFFIYNLSAKFSDIDPAKDGEVRSLALNMLDAKTSCNTKLVQKFDNGNIRTLNIPFLENSIRVRCDAIIFMSYLKNLCPELLKDSLESTIYFHLETRRFTEEKYETVRQIKNVCKK